MREEHRRLVLLRRALLDKKMEKYQIVYIIKRFWLYHETMEHLVEKPRAYGYVSEAFDWTETFESHDFWKRIDVIYRQYLVTNGINS
jgi:hypothetical protein